jgi:hypothetical protein
MERERVEQHKARRPSQNWKPPASLWTWSSISKHLVKPFIFQIGNQGPEEGSAPPEAAPPTPQNSPLRVACLALSPTRHMGCVEWWTSLCRQPGKEAYPLVWESDKYVKNDHRKKPRHSTRKITLPHSLKTFPIKDPGKISKNTRHVRIPSQTTLKCFHLGQSFVSSTWKIRRINLMVQSESLLRRTVMFADKHSSFIHSLSHLFF